MKDIVREFSGILTQSWPINFTGAEAVLKIGPVFQVLGSGHRGNRANLVHKKVNGLL